MSSNKIQAIVFTSFGGGSDYSNVKIKEEDYPKLEGPDYVTVRIKATGLNFAELIQRQGFYKPAQKTPYTPGYEGSGIVEEVGADVTDFKVGDKVLVFSSSGIWKEVVCVPSLQVLRLPENMSFEDGAAFMVNYMTAYHILFELGGLKPGSKVLIHMAAGGVGIAATQLCKTVDDVTIFGTASPGKHELIKQNGVTYPIDYTTKDYAQEIRKISPEGVDIVLDPLNGEDAIKGFGLLKPLGKIIHYGAANLTTENRSLITAVKTWWKSLSVNSLDIISENKSMNGYHLGFLITNSAFREKLRADAHKLLDMYEKGQIKFHIDSKFPFSKINEAMHRMHSRLNVGKIVLIPDSQMPKPEVTEPEKPEIVEKKEEQN